MKKFFITLVLISLIIGVGFIMCYGKYDYYLNTPVDISDSSNIIFEIEEGENSNNIVNNLYDKDLILNKLAVKVYMKLEDIEKELKAGRITLSKSLTAQEIVEKLLNPEEAEVVLTIPEGYTISDIDTLLVDEDLIETGEFISCINECTIPKYDFLDKENISTDLYLEGYLFPDTYFVDPATYTNENFIQKLLNNFDSKLEPDLIEEIQNQDKSIHEIVIMASIIEKEVRTDDDLPIVSGILWKRLKNDWALGADATLLYKKNNNEITYEDLQSDSEYNTRKFKGLPPGPISNPGSKSIKAAVYPEESEYWFYLTTLDTGEVIYAVSNEEHEMNKSEYL